MKWKKLSSKTVFENPFIAVTEDHVINPGGGENDYGVVHFKNRAVAIVPLDDEGNTWIVGQDRYTLGEYSWELPMGGAGEEEALLDAARRELKEETGLLASRWSELLRLHTSNSITDEQGFVFVAEDLVESEPEFEETENIAIRKLPLVEAIEMARQGMITDAISLAALFRLAADGV